MGFGESFEGMLGAARAGQQWAWEGIYRELSPSVLGYLRARRAHEPDDLTAEVFLQVVRDLGSFEGGESAFRAWVFTIANHRLLDERRRNGRRPVESTAIDAVVYELAGGDAEDEALERLAEQGVRRLLDRLSEEQRNVLLLRVVGDLTVEQVGKALGKTPGAIKALQRRGLSALRGEMSKLSVTP